MRAHLYDGDAGGEVAMKLRCRAGCPIGWRWRNAARRGRDPSLRTTYVSYSWGTPEGYTFAVDYNPSSLNEANTIAYIKRYIDQGTPVACHCLKVTKNEHWVIPIEYTSGSGWDSITVFDPYKGVRRSMAEAMNISCGGTSSGVDRIRCHPNHMLG